MFGSATDTVNCQLSEWFISESGGTTAVTSGTTYTRMLIASKSLLLDDLKVDTTIGDIKDY